MAVTLKAKRMEEVMEIEEEMWKRFYSAKVRDSVEVIEEEEGGRQRGREAKEERDTNERERHRKKKIWSV